MPPCSVALMTTIVMYTDQGIFFSALRIRFQQQPIPIFRSSNNSHPIIMDCVGDCLLTTFRVFQYLFSIVALGCGAYSMSRAHIIRDLHLTQRLQSLASFTLYQILHTCLSKASMLCRMVHRMLSASIKIS